MNHDTVLDLLDTLQIYTKNTLRYLEDVQQKGKVSEFETYAEGFYSYLVFHLRPALSEALKEKEEVAS